MHCYEEAGQEESQQGRKVRDPEKDLCHKGWPKGIRGSTASEQGWPIHVDRDVGRLGEEAEDQEDGQASRLYAEEERQGNRAPSCRIRTEDVCTGQIWIGRLAHDEIQPIQHGPNNGGCHWSSPQGRCSGPHLGIWSQACCMGTQNRQSTSTPIYASSSTADEEPTEVKDHRHYEEVAEEIICISSNNLSSGCVPTAM